MKSFTRSIVVLLIALAPTLALAASSVQIGSNGNSGFFGFSNGNSSFSYSYGSGAGGMVCTNTICGVASTIIYLINSVLVPLLFAIAFIMFLYGIAKSYIFSHGEASEVAAGHRLVLWGVIGFAVMVSLWGLVNIVAQTFGLQGAVAPQYPTSYSN